jgi:hypothetical protein
MSDVPEVCPQCQSRQGIKVVNTNGTQEGVDVYCEDCGWPDEDFGGGHQEGCPCPIEECAGHLEYQTPENCACHISPPCSACVENPLTCDVCGLEVKPDS